MSFGKGGGSKIESKIENTGLRNPITWYKEKVGTYPSNVQVWWAMKRPVQATQDNLQKNYLEVFDPELRTQITFGNTLAPKGHYIFNAFDIDRSVVSGVGGLEKETSNGQRPNSCAFYAGRVFYAGTKATKWGARIYFSQILERPSQAGSCHQVQDPTSEEAPDLLPSDGGVIVIPAMAEVIKLFPFGNALWVFATNGIWRIGGSEGAGFRANDYSVSKHTAVPGYGPHSFVEIDGGLLWWNRAGIWAMAADQTGLNMVVTSLTDNTIKDFFDAIPDEAKKYAKGAYNRQSKIVQWVYRSTAPTTVQERYQYNRILNFDTRVGSFYPWRPIESDREGRVYLSGIIAVEGDAVTFTDANVFVGTDQVVLPGSEIGNVLVGLDNVLVGLDQVVAASGVDNVIVSLATRSTVETRFKYLVLLDDSEV